MEERNGLQGLKGNGQAACHAVTPRDIATTEAEGHVRAAQTQYEGWPEDVNISGHGIGQPRYYLSLYATTTLPAAAAAATLPRRVENSRC